MTKSGNAEMLERIQPTLHMHADAFANGAVDNNTKIDAPSLPPKSQAPR